MTERLETGIDALDRKLDGGIPPGSLVVLNAAPASQSEQVIRDLSTTRKTLLLTTRLPRETVERSLHRRGLAPETVAVRAVDPEKPFDSVFPGVRALEERTNLVIDPLDPLEHLPEADYVQFLNRLKTEVSETDSVAILHCLKGPDVSNNRGVTEHMSDVVFDLSTTVNGGLIENRLVVPKFRDGHPFKEVLKLDLRDRVNVDTSRDIG